MDNVEKGHQELVPRMAKSGTVLRADFRVVNSLIRFSVSGRLLVPASSRVGPGGSSSV